MLTSSSVPTIVVDSVAVSSTRVDHQTDVRPCTQTYNNSKEGVVCYGMILDRQVFTCPEAALAYPHSQNVIHFYLPQSLRCYATGNILGRLSQFDGDVLSRLVKDREFRLQLTYHSLPAFSKPGRRAQLGLIGHLETIIYGPRNRLGHLGDYITQCGLFLEDPIGCDENVPCLNPQCLFSLHEQPPMTFELCCVYGTRQYAFERTSSDVLAEFETTDHLEETEKPTAISTDLKSHQRQAPTFLQRRERGLHPSKNEVGIWSGEITRGNKTYVNILTGETQRDPRPDWRGGILADEMGLGKTLSVIALVAADRDAQLTASNQRLQFGTLVGLRSTLIIVPLDVLAVWESQLKLSVSPSCKDDWR
ncbi:hypothetical protein IAQ61_000325 [Plenodomus lingam]|uniref:uncharacterized protein n=1 Tax=Leptosphaeria maculans TaxID=5022 RepID=UPI0033219C00|nr:hypothetical protein IAQ61_000325 [Plenodomus lingam]